MFHSCWDQESIDTEAQVPFNGDFSCQLLVDVPGLPAFILPGVVALVDRHIVVGPVRKLKGCVVPECRLLPIP